MIGSTRVDAIVIFYIAEKRRELAELKLGQLQSNLDGRFYRNQQGAFKSS